MSENTCGVAVDTTVPEVALDMSDSAFAASQWIHALASVFGVYAEFQVFLREDVLADDSCPALRRKWRVSTVDFSVALLRGDELGS